MNTGINTMRIPTALAACLVALPAAGQTTLEWFGLGDGVSFEYPLNWTPNGIPGILDEAKFDNAGLQTVDFASSPANATASIENDTVVFNLNGRTYTLEELIVGDRLADVGSLTVNGGTLRTTTGLARIGRLGTSQGSLILSAGAQMFNDRDLIIGDDANGYLQIDAGCSVSSFVAFVADETTATGDAIIRGAWTIQTGLLLGNAGSGSMTVDAGGDVTVNAQIQLGDEPDSDGTLIVDGAGSTVTAMETTTVGNFGTGSLTVSNGGTLTTAELKIADDAQGDVLIDAGSVVDTVGTLVGNRAAGSLTLRNSGSLQSPLVTVTGLGSLGGSGTVLGPVLSSGAVAPGNDVGSLVITGNYTQTLGSLRIEIGGASAGTGHDQLAVSGTATLGGTLDVTLVNGFSPANGEFVIVQGGVIAGAFATENLPAGFSISYEPDRVIVSIGSNCIADITGDGVLDLADISAFVNAFVNQQPAADLAPPAGVFDLNDLSAFVQAFLAGCP